MTLSVCVHRPDRTHTWTSHTVHAHVHWHRHAHTSTDTYTVSHTVCTVHTWSQILMCTLPHTHVHMHRHSYAPHVQTHMQAGPAYTETHEHSCHHSTHRNPCARLPQLLSLYQTPRFPFPRVPQATQPVSSGDKWGEQGPLST